MMKTVRSYGLFFVSMLLLIFNSIGSGAGTKFRLLRYKKLYERHKCQFPISTKAAPLFGSRGLLSKCEGIQDLTREPVNYNLTNEVCQPLLDELLIYCHANQIPVLKDSGVLSKQNQTIHLTSATELELCQDPLVKKFHKDSAWKQLANIHMCRTICREYMPLCRLQVYIWKLANLSASAETSETSDSVPQTTAAPTTPSPTTTPRHTTTVEPTPPPVKPTPTKTMHEILQGILNKGKEGEDNTKETGNSNSKAQTGVSHHKSIGMVGKLFIFFGVFSIILIVAGYVAYYKRSQIRAFCCEDSGDIRYRRIREDRKQQAAQPLKNLAF